MFMIVLEQKSRSILQDGSRYLWLFWNKNLDPSYKMDPDIYDCFGSNPKNLAPSHKIDLYN